MPIEKLLGLVALAWLIGACLLLARSIRRGRHLADAFAKRHPDAFEKSGRPRPGFLPGMQRDRFARFVARREYNGLADPPLAAQFEEHRRSEARLVLFLGASVSALMLLILVVRNAD